MINLLSFFMLYRLLLFMIKYTQGIVIMTNTTTTNIATAVPAITTTFPELGPGIGVPTVEGDDDDGVDVDTGGGAVVGEGGLTMNVVSI